MSLNTQDLYSFINVPDHLKIAHTHKHIRLNQKLWMLKNLTTGEFACHSDDAGYKAFLIWHDCQPAKLYADTLIGYEPVQFSLNEWVSMFMPFQDIHSLSLFDLPVALTGRQYSGGRVSIWSFIRFTQEVK